MQRHGGNWFGTMTPIRIMRLAFSFSSLSSPSPPPQSHDFDRDDETEMLCRLLEACKLSKDIKTTSETHGRIIRFGYGTLPSLTASLILAYARCGCHDTANSVIDQLISSTSNLVVLNLIIEYCVQMRKYEIAKKVFDKMHSRDVVTWNSMIGGYVRNARFEEALGLFRVMLGLNVEPDKFTFASVLSACAKLGAVGHAKWVHGLMIQKITESNTILSAALIDMYSRCGKIEIAKEVFDSVERNDVCIWNAIINGLAVHGLAFDAIEIFSRMDVENVLPDSLTFLGILKACSHCGLVKEGRNYFGLMRNRYSIQPQLQHYGAMVDLLGRAGLVEEIYDVIEAMPMEPDVIIWRTLLSACRTYRKTELGEVAIRNISRLNGGDYVLMSNIYCSQNQWDSAQTVREMMKTNGVRKGRGKSWLEWAGVFHRFKSGDRSHPEMGAVFRVLEGLIRLTKLEGYVPMTDLVMMDVTEEEREGNLNHHSEKLALAYGILKSSPGTDILVSKNLRICYDCHNWMKMVSRILSRVIIIRDRIRFHRFEGGSCSCGDYW